MLGLAVEASMACEGRAEWGANIPSQLWEGLAVAFSFYRCLGAADGKEAKVDSRRADVSGESKKRDRSLSGPRFGSLRVRHPLNILLCPCPGGVTEESPAGRVGERAQAQSRPEAHVCASTHSPRDTHSHTVQ